MWLPSAPTRSFAIAPKNLLSPSHRQQLNCSDIQRIAPSAPHPPSGPPGCRAWSDIAPLLVEIVEEPIVFLGLLRRAYTRPIGKTPTRESGLTKAPKRKGWMLALVTLAWRAIGTAADQGAIRSMLEQFSMQL